MNPADEYRESLLQQLALIYETLNRKDCACGYSKILREEYERVTK